MIEYDVVQETGSGSRFDRATAVLIGFIAILAAMLAVVQLDKSQAEARANATSARLTSDIAARIPASGVYLQLAIGALQDAVSVSLVGSARQIVGIQTNDEASIAKGEAANAAGDRLLEIARRMGETPTETSPVPPYPRRLVAATEQELTAEVAEQNRQVVLADRAGAGAGLAVVGLSMVALAGVLVGLAAVLGEIRAGKVTLAIAYAAATAALVALVAAVM